MTRESLPDSYAWHLCPPIWSQPVQGHCPVLCEASVWKWTSVERQCLCRRKISGASGKWRNPGDRWEWIEINKPTPLLVKLEQGACIVQRSQSGFQSIPRWTVGAPMAEGQEEHALPAACQQADWKEPTRGVGVGGGGRQTTYFSQSSNQIWPLSCGRGLAGRVKAALLPSISRKTDVSGLQTLVRMLA